MEVRMEVKFGKYCACFTEGGVQLRREGRLLYYNKRPLYALVKTAEAITDFYDAPYREIALEEGRVTGRGTVDTAAGSRLSFADTYEPAGEGLKISRKVRVEQAGDDLGFATKLSFTMEESSEYTDYQYFAPGVWYLQNEYAPPWAIGKGLDAEYFWRFETRYALPLFAMQSNASGEMISLSRFAADVTLRNLDIVMSETTVDPSFTIASIGMSRPEDRTLNYLYYGYAVRRETDTVSDGLSIDYVYPGTESEIPRDDFYASIDFGIRSRRTSYVFHPMEEGFAQEYAVAVDLGQYDGFQPMMRSIWRRTYERMRDRLFAVDNEQHYRNCMYFLRELTRRYGESYGLPFAAQLPHMDANSVSFQFGFVGQQPGIGYQLLRYGDLYQDQEAWEKGRGILDFWVKNAMTKSGAPAVCYHPAIGGWEPYPFWTRMIADGMEAVLDGWLYLHKKGTEEDAWLAFCTKTADWYVRIQNEDGSYYRSYKEDGSVNMDSKANTPSPIRFLIQMYLVTGDASYRQAAVRAGEWAYENQHLKMEYRGGTCDNLDVTDKEAGIYALFGFMALYDLTADKKWLEAAVSAADYTETWTYAWTFPVVAPQPVHPFNHYSISGQSIITLGGGADVYMAACSYTYYRLYLLTGDVHYRDFAEFIHNNTRQANDVDGSVGYRYRGLGHESGNFALQVLDSHYHWLPWCTFVEIDPVSRLYDTFGVYEIADAERLGMEERCRKNRIYENYCVNPV